MRKGFLYRILGIGLSAAFAFMVPMGAAWAQEAQEQGAQPFVPSSPTQAEMYCSGVITDQSVPYDSYVISGENSRYRSSFTTGEEIYINRGAENGVKVGDQFDVMRPVRDDMAKTWWFKYEAMLTKAMGTRYADVGRLRVVHVDAKTSTTELNLACGATVQRGDIIRPFAARPAPQFHQAKLDPFAPPSGKKTAMIVNGRDFAVLAGPGAVMYVNLGSSQGVRVGDYFRIFRYQGTHIESNYQIHDMAFKVYGFGSAPVAYEWNNLPRQILGEGIVLRTGPNSSTVLVTDVRFEMYAGDYVELE